MIYGSQYYRPPFPYRGCWENDLDNMVSLGFNTVKLWAVWNWIEREPGVFQFDDLDALTALCAKKGLSVVINLIPEGAPYWTSDDKLGAFYEMSTGEQLKYSGPGNIPTAGWPGLCPDSPDYAALIYRFCYETAKHFAADPAVTCFDVWNEPHLEPMYDYPDSLLCYCEHTQAKFRGWLQSRYGTLEKLNAAWFRCYSNWEQVEAPRRYGTAADMIDWRRFGMDNLRALLHDRAAAVRRGAPGKTVQTHVAYSGYMGQVNDGGLAKDLTDEFLLAREVDQFGLSAFPLWLMGTEHIGQHFMNAEVVAEASRGKPFYQVELQGGGGKEGLLAGVVPKEPDVRQWNWSVIAAGGKGVVYWQYKPEPAGMESPGFGLVNIDGTNTPRSREAGNCARKFLALKLEQFERCLSSNAIFLSRNSDLLANAVQEEKKYNNSFKGYHQALTDRGIPCRFAHADYADTLYAEGVRTLYLPMTLSLCEDERRALTAYVKAGGTLVLEAGAGSYRENGELEADGSFLRELLGMQSVNFDLLRAPETVYTLDGRRTGEFCYYRQGFASCAADVTVKAVFSDGSPAILTRSFGAGRIVWFGGFAGGAYWNTRDDATADLIASYANANGYVAIRMLSSSGMLVRLLESDTEYALVCVNRTDEPRTLIYDINGLCTVTVPACDGVVEFVSRR